MALLSALDSSDTLKDTIFAARRFRSEHVALRLMGVIYIENKHVPQRYVLTLQPQRSKDLLHIHVINMDEQQIFAKQFYPSGPSWTGSVLYTQTFGSVWAQSGTSWRR